MVRGSNDKLVVLSHGFWQRQFGGSKSVIGMRVVLGGDFVRDRRRDAGVVSLSIAAHRRLHPILDDS